MLSSVPVWVSLFFLLTASAVIGLFYRAVKNKPVLYIILAVTMLQSAAALTGFYNDFASLPPKIMVGMFPSLLLVLYAGFGSPHNKLFALTDCLWLTLFHTIRIPVEILLSILFHYGAISVWQTIEGTNFDLFSGITAPLIAYFGYHKKVLSRTILIGWNILCLLLLFNVVITSALAMPYSFQVISMYQPNIAIGYFPFNLLPTVIVPLVILAHIILLRKLVK